jgi:hypothetical protein
VLFDCSNPSVPFFPAWIEENFYTASEVLDSRQIRDFSLELAAVQHFDRSNDVNTTTMTSGDCNYAPCVLPQHVSMEANSNMHFPAAPNGLERLQSSCFPAGAEHPQQNSMLESKAPSAQPSLPATSMHVFMQIYTHSKMAKCFSPSCDHVFSRHGGQFFYWQMMDRQTPETFVSFHALHACSQTPTHINLRWAQATHMSKTFSQGLKFSQQKILSLSRETTLQLRAMRSAIDASTGLSGFFPVRAMDTHKVCAHTCNNLLLLQPQGHCTKFSKMERTQSEGYTFETSLRWLGRSLGVSKWFSAALYAFPAYSVSLKHPIKAVVMGLLILS